jgi:hypothetical protein
MVGGKEGGSVVSVALTQVRRCKRYAVHETRARGARDAQDHSRPVVYVVWQLAEDAEARLIRAPPPSTFVASATMEIRRVPRLHRRGSVDPSLSSTSPRRAPTPS